jgi:hypothetical protein
VHRRRGAEAKKRTPPPPPTHIYIHTSTHPQDARATPPTGTGTAREATGPPHLVVLPLAVVQLLGSEALQLVLGHGVENIKQGFQLELLQVAGFQLRGGHGVARGHRELRVAGARDFGPRRAKGRVQGPAGGSGGSGGEGGGGGGSKTRTTDRHVSDRHVAHNTHQGGARGSPVPAPVGV